MKFNKFKNDKRGQVALFIVFFVMMLMLFIGLFMMNMILAQTKVVRNAVNSTQAFYYADMGAERALWGAKSASGFDKIEISNYAEGDEIYPEGRTAGNPDGVTVTEYKVYRDAVANPDVLGIRAVGVFKNTSRSIQLTW